MTQFFMDIVDPTGRSMFTNKYDSNGIASAGSGVLTLGETEGGWKASTGVFEITGGELLPIGKYILAQTNEATALDRDLIAINIVTGVQTILCTMLQINSSYAGGYDGVGYCLFNNELWLIHTNSGSTSYPGAIRSYSGLGLTGLDFNKTATDISNENSILNNVNTYNLKADLVSDGYNNSIADWEMSVSKDYLFIILKPYYATGGAQTLTYPIMISKSNTIQVLNTSITNPSLFLLKADSTYNNKVWMITRDRTSTLTRISLLTINSPTSINEKFYQTSSWAAYPQQIGLSYRGILAMTSTTIYAVDTIFEEFYESETTIEKRLLAGYSDGMQFYYPYSYLDIDGVYLSPTYSANQTMSLPYNTSPITLDGLMLVPTNTIESYSTATWLPGSTTLESYSRLEDGKKLYVSKRVSDGKYVFFGH